MIQRSRERLSFLAVVLQMAGCTSFSFLDRSHIVNYNGEKPGGRCVYVKSINRVSRLIDI